MPRLLNQTEVLLYIVSFSLLSVGCGVTAPSVSLVTSRPTMKVSDWPFWQDVKVESDDYDKVWTTVLDILSEQSAIAVLEKQSGYIQTEWKNRIDKSYNDEWRFTAKILPDQNLVRVGFESRWVDTREYVSRIYADDQSLWKQVIREIEDRL